MPHAAAAAEFGPGYQQPGKPLNHLGGYRTSDGTIAYCIDIGDPSPLGGITTEGDHSEQINGLAPAAMLQLGVVLARHGETVDATTAAAVAMTVWSIADEEEYRAAGGDEHILRRAPESERAAILALATGFRAEAAAFDRPTPRAELRLTIDDHDERRGTLEVDIDPDTALATVTLEGAEFVDGDTGDEDDAVSDIAASVSAGSAASRTVADDDPASRSVADGDTLQFVTTDRNVPGPFRVSASTDDITETGAVSAAVRVFITPNAQTLVAAGAPIDLVASARATDIRERSTPVLSTSAQPAASAGGTVRDHASFTGIPRAGAWIRFDGYLQPASTEAPVCTDETLLYSSAEPHRVDDDGEISSEPFAVTADHVGTVLWVATVSTESGDVLQRGDCGDPAETTLISAPPRLPVVSG